MASLGSFCACDSVLVLRDPELAASSAAFAARGAQSPAAPERTHAWYAPGEGHGSGEEGAGLDERLRELYAAALGGEHRLLANGAGRGDLALPLGPGGASQGCLLLCGLRVSPQCSEEWIQLLRFAGELIGGVLERARLQASQAELERQRAQSQRLEAIGTLAGGVAHDFNNLLTGILGYAGMLLQDPNDAQAVERAASIIETAALRAADLTQKLSSFAREEHGRRERVDLHAMLSEVMVLLRRTLREDIRIELALEAEGPHVEADPAQLHQVLLNLVVNARDAMPHGGLLSITSEELCLEEPGEHALEELAAGTYLRIGVHDRGVGIPPELSDRIFEPYFSIKQARGGTGMGLAMVYAIVRGHGGAVRAESRPGEGTSMHVYLPARSAPEPERELLPRPQPHMGSGRVLVVDDDAVVRETAAAMLRRLGYEVELAESGEQALRRFREAPRTPDLVLLDVAMPHMNGLECLRHLRAADPGVRVLLCSGWDLSGCESAEREGALGMIPKPYRLDELARRVAEALQCALGDAHVARLDSETGRSLGPCGGVDNAP